MSRKPKAHEVLPAADAAPIATAAVANAEPAKTPPLRSRHYLQRFDETTELVWAKHCTCFGKPVKPGDPVERAKFRVDKLRRLWDSGFVQAKEWDAVTSRRTRTSRRRRIA